MTAIGPTKEMSFLFMYLGCLNICIRFKILLIVVILSIYSHAFLFQSVDQFKGITTIQLKDTVFISHGFNRQHNTVEIALSKELGDLNSSPGPATNFFRTALGKSLNLSC